MVSSILRETSVSPHDVETELQSLAAVTKSARRNLTIAVGSLLLFVLIGAMDAGLVGIVILATVVLVHERMRLRIL